jgi:hypothetical protein
MCRIAVKHREDSAHQFPGYRTGSMLATMQEALDPRIARVRDSGTCWR